MDLAVPVEPDTAGQIATTLPSLRAWHQRTWAILLAEVILGTAATVLLWVQIGPVAAILGFMFVGLILITWDSHKNRCLAAIQPIPSAATGLSPGQPEVPEGLLPSGRLYRTFGLQGRSDGRSLTFCAVQQNDHHDEVQVFNGVVIGVEMLLPLPPFLAIRHAETRILPRLFGPRHDPPDAMRQHPPLAWGALWLPPDTTPPPWLVPLLNDLASLQTVTHPPLRLHAAMSEGQYLHVALDSGSRLVSVGSPWRSADLIHRDLLENLRTAQFSRLLAARILELEAKAANGAPSAPPPLSPSRSSP